MAEQSPLHRLRETLRENFWNPETAERHWLFHAVFQFLRGITLVWKGIVENNLPIRAAGLSYYTLLSIGPILVVVLTVGSFFVDQESDVATKALVRLVEFIAPPVAEYDQIIEQEQTATDPAAVEGPASEPELLVDQDLVALINTFLDNAGARAGGAISFIILTYLVLSLLALIETTLNEIWGVRQGRSLVKKVLLYWTLLSLGTILFFASFTLLSGATFTRIFQEVPLVGGPLGDLIQYTAPLVSFLMVGLLLALFYKFFPNVSVAWGPALVGGLVVAMLLAANNLLSFVYVRQVISQRSFYGSLGIVTLFMFSLYIFWFIILVGGQITYAVQNLGILLRQRAWQKVGARTQDTLTLAVMVLIGRRFQSCQAAPTVEELTRQLNLPTRMVNQALGRLVEHGWLHAQETKDDSGEEQTRYPPSRPLEKVVLGELSYPEEDKGGASALAQMRKLDPVVGWYLDAQAEERERLNRVSLAELLASQQVSDA